MVPEAVDDNAHEDVEEAIEEDFGDSEALNKFGEEVEGNEEEEVVDVAEEDVRS